jgi:hypothetical protein
VRIEVMDADLRHRLALATPETSLAPNTGLFCWTPSPRMAGMIEDADPSATAEGAQIVARLRLSVQAKAHGGAPLQAVSRRFVLTTARGADTEDGPPCPRPSDASALSLSMGGDASQTAGGAGPTGASEAVEPRNPPSPQSSSGQGAGLSAPASTASATDVDAAARAPIDDAGVHTDPSALMGAPMVSTCTMTACAHGTCLEGSDFPLTCLCHAGYAGASCNEVEGGGFAEADPRCVPWHCVHGRCNVDTQKMTEVDGISYPFECTCDPGWSADDCSVPVA